MRITIIIIMMIIIIIIIIIIIMLIPTDYCFLFVFDLLFSICFLL